MTTEETVLFNKVLKKLDRVERILESHLKSLDTKENSAEWVKISVIKKLTIWGNNQEYKKRKARR